MSTLEYVLMTAVFFGAGAVIWMMASGKLPAYVIEDGNGQAGNSVPKAETRSESTHPDLTEDEQKILAFIKNRGRVKNDDVEELLGVSDTTATRYLQALVGKGVIAQKGEGKGTYYERA